MKVALRAVWGAKPDAIWAVGEAGVALRWNGVRWLQIPTGVEQELLAVGGVSEKDVWAVGQAGTALHFDGKAWREVSMGTRHQFTALVALAADDVWAVGQDPGTRRWTGGAGGEEARESEGGRRASGSLFHWDGERWQRQSAGPGPLPPLRAAAASAGGQEVWAVGLRAGADGGPAIARWRGGTWAREAGPGDGDLTALYSGGEELYAAGARGIVFARSSGRWTALDAAEGASYEGLWASGRCDLWAVGSAVRHFDGRAWRSLGVEGGAPVLLHAVWGAGPGEVWAVGERGTALRCASGAEGS